MQNSMAMYATSTSSREAEMQVTATLYLLETNNYYQGDLNTLKKKECMHGSYAMAARE